MFDVEGLMWGLKVTRAVPEKHRINFRGLSHIILNDKNLTS